MISSSSSTASSSPATSANVTFGWSFDDDLACDLPKPMTRLPPPCTWPSTHSSTSASSTNGSRLKSRLSHGLSLWWSMSNLLDAGVDDRPG